MDQDLATVNRHLLEIASDPVMTERQHLEEKIRLLEQQAHLEEGLPHLYGLPWYQWGWDYFNSTNRYNFLVAANQVGKSTAQIRKCIHWATEPSLWPKLWKRKPTQFWYLYPSLEVATAEFKEKWVKELMPRAEFKDHEQYGWEAFYHQKKIQKIEFKSGVTLYFHSYEQDPENLQTASVFAIFCDEELPAHLYPELNARISGAAIRGYWHMCFTATLGQETWRLCMEEKGTKHETFKKAFKLNVSLYDCRKYKDGSDSPWDDEAIQDVVDSCQSEAEVKRRVFGRFVLDVDRSYPGFVRSKNYTKGHLLPKNWLIYTGIDVGSGGENGHPAAVTFLAVKPDFTAGRVFRTWRGDKIPTTAGDVLDKYVELKGKLRPVGEYYDWQCRDLYTIAQGRKPAVPLQKAEKGQDTGRTLLNTLFKNGMLEIYDDCPENMKMVLEFEGLRKTTKKSHARDDLIDSLRFAATKVPWNFTTEVKKVKAREAEPKTERERYWKEQKDKKSGLDLIEAEIDLANEAFDYMDSADGEFM